MKMVFACEPLISCETLIGVYLRAFAEAPVSSEQVGSDGVGSDGVGSVLSLGS